MFMHNIFSHYSPIYVYVYVLSISDLLPSALPSTKGFFVVRINATVVELLWDVTGGPVSNYYLFWCKWRKQAGRHCQVRDCKFQFIFDFIEVDETF